MGTASQSQEEPSCLASTLCSQGAARSFKQVLSSHARYAHCHVSGDGIIIGYGRCYTHVHSAARPGLCGSHWKRGGGLEALPSPEFPCAQHGTLARAQQLALAYVIFHYSSTPSALERFAHLEAIVQLFCQRTLGVARHPSRRPSPRPLSGQQQQQPTGRFRATASSRTSSSSLRSWPVLSRNPLPRKSSRSSFCAIH